MGDMVSFPCPDGTEAQGYFADVPGAKSGVVVIQEWWGLNDQIKGVAEKFAAHGYLALAPDLYSGRVTSEPDEANHMMEGLDWVGATDQEVAGALQYVKARTAHAAVCGFCMGGALTIIAGVKLDGCDAAVCYYGIPPVEQADPAAMRVPFLGHFATDDDWCTPAAVDELEAAVRRSGVPVEIHRYEAAHAFFNEHGAAYDAAVAAASWQRTLTFLDEYL